MGAVVLRVGPQQQERDCESDIRLGEDPRRKELNQEELANLQTFQTQIQEIYKKEEKI